MDAVIDIGSNSVRLMLYEGAAVTPKAVRTTVLSEGLANTGYLSNDAMARTRAAIAFFVREAQDKSADNIWIFATEAMRSAKNGDEFRVSIEGEIGVPVQIVSGNDEARLGIAGALTAFRPYGELTVIDIGGASVEIVRGDEKRLSYAKSLPLGVTRLKDGVGDNRADIERFVAENIRRFGPVSGTEGVAIGGTATTLASMALSQRAYDPYAVHGYELTLPIIDALTDRIFSGIDICAAYPTVPPKRARIIGHGAIMLRALTEYMGLSSVTVSESDNLEGFLYLKKRALI